MSPTRPSLTSLTDPAALLVLDTSTVINLNASGCARKLIEALPNPLGIADIVPNELEGGRHRSRQDSDLLKELVAFGLIKVAKLEEGALPYFEQLVIGPAASTLDDGEAATIAYAVSQGGFAIIDERKANRICSQRFPKLRIGCTVDIFAHPNVQHVLGREHLANAVFNALHHGRMRVLQHHLDWVVELIGAERATICTSLPNSVRALKTAFDGCSDCKSPR